MKPMTDWMRRVSKRQLAIGAVLTAVLASAAVAYWTIGPAGSGNSPAERKIAYYKNPMGTGHVSDRPMKDEMGMDYIPVYTDEAERMASAEPGLVTIDPSMVQNIGVRTVTVAKGRVAGEISANGVIALNETRTASVTTKIAGYIEKLHIKAVGQTFTEDTPLYDMYSPELDALLQEYLSALRYQGAVPADAAQSLHRNATELVLATHMRLESLGLRKAQLKKMQSDGGVPRAVTFFSTQGGTVLKKNVLEGSFVPAGTELFQLADLSELWLLADVYAQDYARLRVGSRARVSVQGMPEKTFQGIVDFIYPTVDPQTRVAKVRIVLANPQGLLRPDMFAHVTIEGPSHSRLMLPKSAVLRGGKRDWVILALGGGKFRPQEVQLGIENNDQQAVIAGVKEGDVVVSSAQFLLDSESKLQEIFEKLKADNEGK